MTQAIVRLEDFTSSSTAHQIQGFLHRGEGSPLGKSTCINLGAIYLDMLSGNMWTCTIINDTSGWKPFYSQLTTSITIASDVQEGDFVGIYGAGSWATGPTVSSTRELTSGNGSQNAGMIAGGLSITGTVVLTTELFNGTAWTASGNLNTSRYRNSSLGSQNAAIAAGGKAADLTSSLSSTEIFNGATWTASTNLNASRAGMAPAGSQNAGMIAGSDTGAASSVDIFNGIAWSASTNLLTSRDQVAGIGSINAALVAGGSNGTTNISSIELFNGSTWILGSNYLVSASGISGAGSQNAGLMVGGSSNGSRLTLASTFNGITWSASGVLSRSRFVAGVGGSQDTAFAVCGTAANNSSELHTQSTYRKLNWSNIANASNIGMAVNTTLTSYSATLNKGDLPNTRLPSKTFFGFSKFTAEQTVAYLEASRNITSITATGSSSVFTIATSNTDVCKGMLLEVSNATNTNNNGMFPITGYSGGTSVTIKNVNGVTQAGAVGTVRLVWGNRLSGLVGTSITKSGSVLTVNFASAGGLSATQFQRLVKVGSAFYLPYSSTTGAAGSSLNYGTYVVTGVGSLNLTVTSQNTNSATEASMVCSTMEIFNQCFMQDKCGIGEFLLGYNNRMNLLQRPATDESTGIT